MSRYLFILILLLFSAASGENIDIGIINIHVQVDGFRNDKGYCFLLLFKDKKGFPESEKHAAFILKKRINDEQYGLSIQ